MFQLTQIVVVLYFWLSITYGSPAIGLYSPASNRIYGGTEASLGQFPYMVSLRAFRNESSRHVCGGSLITDRFVLTAAHCIVAEWLSPSKFQIVVGAHRNYTENDGIAYAVQTLIPHEQFYAIESPEIFQVQHDIGLVETTKEIQFNDLVAPIALHDSFIATGESVFTMGWGRTNVSLINLFGKNKRKCSTRLCFEWIRTTSPI